MHSLELISAVSFGRARVGKQGGKLGKKIIQVTNGKR
jgi:hypothetical protein